MTDELYGAGRMLKNAGVDQFAIPERLAAMDQDQIDHFTRMYQRQAIVVARHIDDMSLVERFLRQSGWAEQLDDVLTLQLPMPDAQLKDLTRSPSKAANDSERLDELFATSPFPETRVLASIARMSCLPASLDAEIFDASRGALDSDDQQIRDEAALVFSNWRLLTSARAFAFRRPLADALRRCSFTDDAALGLLLMGEDATPPQAMLASVDADVAFQAAMAFAEPETLVSALNIPDRQFAAAWRLAQTQPAAAIGPLLGTFEDDEQVVILEQLRRTDCPLDMLHDSLIDRAQRGAPEVRSLAIGLVANMGRAEDACRLVALCCDDWSLHASTVQTILRKLTVGADVEEFCRFLVNEGQFRSSQYGVSELATDGRLADNFVPSVWGHAGDDEARESLLRFAEEQLNARADETLHSFVLRQVFGLNSAHLRAQAWWVLKRWYARDTYGSSGPLQLEERALTKYFGSVVEFLDSFSLLLGDPATLAEITLQEKLADMLRYCDNTALPAIVGNAAAFGRFAAALERVVRDVEIRQYLRSAIVRFYEHLATVDGQREQMLTELDAVAAEVPDLQYDASGTANRIREGIYVN